MSYINIPPLWKDQTILMFKEVWSLEKIHGTSSHITWKAQGQTIHYHRGGGNTTHDQFVALFPEDLKQMLQAKFPAKDVNIYGECYGSYDIQGEVVSVYGEQLRFIAFDVQVQGIRQTKKGEVEEMLWLDVPKADKLCKEFNIPFVYYEKTSTDIAELDAHREKDSVQAIRNGMGTGHHREGVVLRPLIELTKNNGERIIAKHRRDEFGETKTPRPVNAEEFRILEDAKAIAEEWATPRRLQHVLDKLPKDLTIRDTKTVIEAMVADIYREADGEIIQSEEAAKAIGTETALMFRELIKKNET